MNLSYFILGIIAYQIVKLLVISINREIIRHRQRKFLKLVRVLFPDHSEIRCIAVDGSDKRAMARLERQLREQYDLEQEEVSEGNGYGGRDITLRSD